MNLINILGVFTVLTQFPAIKTYPALEVMLEVRENKYYYVSIVRDDVTVQKIKLKKNQRFLYLCRPKNEAQQKLAKKCKENFNENILIAEKISSSRTTVDCLNEITPDMKQGENKCGKNGEGIMYYLYYTICFRAIYKYLELQGDTELLNDENTLLEDHTLLDKRSIIVYSFCFDHATRETLFVRYDISSLKTEVPPVPSTFEEKFSFLDNDPFNLKQASQCYEEQNQEQAIDYMYVDEPIRGDDRLVEQMLVPWGFVASTLSKGTTENYVNIRPQRESIREDWQKLNTAIKEKSKMEWRKSYMVFDYPIHRGFLVYSGTYGQWKLAKDRSPEIIRIGNIQQDGQDEPQLTESLSQETSEQVSDNVDAASSSNTTPLSTTVPVFWWMLVTTIFKTQGMVLIMSNYPKSKVNSSDIPVTICPDICHMTAGWDFVKTISPRIICCQPTDELLEKLFNNYVKIEKEEVLILDNDLEKEDEKSLKENLFVTLQ